MSWAVRAWRDATGAAGIIIGTVTPVGWDNHVAEIILEESEMDGFLSQCAAARQRAGKASRFLEEPMPGPYEGAGWQQ